MKKPKKSTLLASAAVALAISAAGAGVINAQTASSTSTNRMSSLVTAIAQKFNLNTADVQTVVDQTMEQDRAAHEAQEQQAFATRLSDAVTAGKLTQAQADLITAKAAELKATMDANRTANQSLTQEQIKTKMDEQRTALQSWATANNIPTEYLHFVGGRGMGGRGHGFGGPRGDFNKSSSTTSTTTQ